MLSDSSRSWLVADKGTGKRFEKASTGFDRFANFWVNFLTPFVWARDTSPPKNQS